MGHMWTSTKFINQTMNLRKLSPAARGADYTLREGILRVDFIFYAITPFSA